MLLNSVSSFTKSFLKSSINANTLNLTTVPQCSIVYRYIKKRSPFDKTNYIDDYIPPQVKYHKTRKPRLPHWDDPNVHWPPVMQRPTKLQGKELIKSIENRERHIISALRPFRVPDIRTGDVIEFKYLFSISEGLGNILTGIVIGRRKPNSYDASFKVLMRLAGEQLVMDFKELSPFLVDIKILSRGSGNLRGSLAYLKEKGFNREQMLKPIVKGKMRRRKEDIRKLGRSSIDQKTKYDVNDDRTY